MDGPPYKGRPEEHTMTTRSRRVAKLSEAALVVLSASSIQGDRVLIPRVGRDDAARRRAKAEAHRALIQSGGRVVSSTHGGVTFDPGLAPLVLDAIQVLGHAVTDPRTVRLADDLDTPRALADDLVAYAKVDPAQAVLEPSAGVGSLADALRRVGVTPDCVENVGRGRAALLSKGHVVVGGDFVTYWPARRYDRVLMCPPISFGQAFRHTLKAYKLLKVDGVLVSVVPAAFTWWADDAAELLRQIVHDSGGMSVVPDGTYAVAATGDAIPMCVVTATRRPLPGELGDD